MGRRVVGAVALAVLAAIWLPVLAAANPEHERHFTDLVAQERSSAGLAGYAEVSDLVDVARRQAQRMAAEGRLYHNQQLADDVKDWEAVGENVGRGPSVDTIHRAFMDSSTHRGEILSTTFTQVGIGVAVAGDGEIWVAQVFRKPQAAPPPPAPAPTSPPTTAAPVAERPVVLSAASTRQQPPPVRSSRAGTVAPPTSAPAPPAPPTTVVVAEPDLTPLERAFEIPLATAEASATINVEPDVTVEVRVAATLLVVTVAALAMHVTEVCGGATALLPQWLSRSRRRLAATAATLP